MMQLISVLLRAKKMQIVDLKTEGAGLHGVARLTFKCGE